MQKINLLVVFSFIALPLLAQESATQAYIQQQRTLAIQAAQNNNIPGDIYRGSVFGAEQKKYPSTTLGERPLLKTKKVYDTSLMRAVKADDEDSVRTLLYSHVDANERNYAGVTPLSVAAEKGNLAIVKLLVNVGGADVNLSSSFGVTPLIAASAAGHTDVVKFLIDNGANSTVSDNMGKDPLAYAALAENPEMVNILSKKNQTGINLPDSTGMTPLLHAAQKGYTEQAKVLLKNGADPNYRIPSSGLSPLAAAVAEGHDDIVQLLLQKYKADPDIPDAQGRTPLMYAIEHDQDEAVRLLLKQKADVNATDNHGMTPLMYAVAKDNLNILNRLFRQKTIRLHQPDDLNRTPLFYSIYAPTTQSAHQLLLRGADINHVDLQGNTPLMAAILAQDDQKALFFLSHEECNIGAINRQGENAFTLAGKKLPGSMTQGVLRVKLQGVQQQTLQEQAARLAEVRNLEQQLAQEEAHIRALKAVPHTTVMYDN